MFIFKEITNENDNFIGQLCHLIKEYNKNFYAKILKEDDIEYLNSFCENKYLKNEISLNKKHFYFIEDKNKQTIGYIKFTIEDNTLFIKQLYLQNTTKEFINFLKSFSKKHNLNKITFFVPNNKDKQIQEMINFGFENIKEICLFLGNDIYVYGRKLSIILE